MKVNNKVFVVTGGGGGIGGALIETLLDRGAKVAAVDMRQEFLDKLKDRLGTKSENLSLHALNITDKNAVAKLPAEVIKAQGSIDGLINCAGIIQPFLKVNDLDYEAIDRVMKVNFFGTLYMTKAFLPELLKRPEAHIANISSMGGFLPVPGQSVYGASKAAVKLFTEGLFAELQDTNVKVTVVFPGATQTDISKNSGVKGPEMPTDDQKKIPMLTAMQAAKIIIDGVESNKPQIYTGKDSKSMNLLYRLNPVYATKLIAKQMASLLK